MPNKREITKIECFISIRTLIRTVCDECPTDEDAIAFIEEGLVKINEKVIMDPYYGVNGRFRVQINNVDRYYIFNKHAGNTMQKHLLVFANKPENLRRLREGEVLVYENITKKYGLRGFHISIAPPDFSGSVLTACYFGFTTGPGRHGYWGTSIPQAITECGTRV